MQGVISYANEPPLQASSSRNREYHNGVICTVVHTWPKNQSTWQLLWVMQSFEKSLKSQISDNSIDPLQIQTKLLLWNWGEDRLLFITQHYWSIRKVTDFYWQIKVLLEHPSVHWKVSPHYQVQLLSSPRKLQGQSCLTTGIPHLVMLVNTHQNVVFLCVVFHYMLKNCKTYLCSGYM